MMLQDEYKERVDVQMLLKIESDDKPYEIFCRT
jgi:hypothetical protein